MLVVDPARAVPVDRALFADTFGFTAAENQIAAMLAAGRTPHEIACATGRSEGTVRWHLKQIFAKSGVSRQSDVVRLVLSLSVMGNDVR